MGCGGDRPSPDDSALRSDLASGRGGDEVTFHGTLIADPAPVGSHEHLLVNDSFGDRLEVDHNTGLAPWVPAHTGDGVVVRGRLYIDAPGRAGVHCTHARTSSGCPIPGWVELRGQYYE